MLMACAIHVIMNTHTTMQKVKATTIRRCNVSRLVIGVTLLISDSLIAARPRAWRNTSTFFDAASGAAMPS